MGNKENSNRNDSQEKGKREGTFADNSKERKQDFTNEQNPELENYSSNRDHKDKSSGNLSDQYHSATESGKAQNEKNLENTKAAHQGDEYYDQGAHQPSSADLDDVDEKDDQKDEDNQ